MLQVTIPSIELFDETNHEFMTSKECTLQLEHSLVSLSKWESKWHKPFLTKESKTFLESIDYVRCMTLTQNVSDDVYTRISADIMNEINDYILAPMTATTFPPDDKRGGRQVITAELIYHWMIAFNIPFECQKWHLNRLFTLINLCNIKNSPAKKLSRNEIAERNRTINDARRKASNTKG